MKQFFINAENGIEDDRIQKVLQGGIDDMKRLHSIDDELYGTNKGIQIKQQTQFLSFF